MAKAEYKSSMRSKRLIYEALADLLLEKPLEKITVRDIVDHCGINRHTFYYHFQDIYAVFEEICRVCLSKAEKKSPAHVLLSHLFLSVSQQVAPYKKSAQRLIVSLGRDGFERYTSPLLDDLIYAALARDHKAAKEDLATATLFLRHAFVGLFIDHLNQPKEHDAATLAERISKFSRGVCRSLC